MQEMTKQLVELPKRRYQDGIHRRAVEYIVVAPAPVLPEWITERFSEHDEVFEVTKTSSQDQELQRTVEQTFVDLVKVNRIVFGEVL